MDVWLVVVVGGDGDDDDAAHDVLSVSDVRVADAEQEKILLAAAEEEVELEEFVPQRYCWEVVVVVRAEGLGRGLLGERVVGVEPYDMEEGNVPAMVVNGQARRRSSVGMVSGGKFGNGNANKAR